MIFPVITNIGIVSISFITIILIKKWIRIYDKRFVYMFIVLMIVSVFCTFRYMKIKSRYAISTIATYNLTLDSMNRISYNDNIYNLSDIKGFNKKIIDIYKHISLLAVQMNNTNLVDRNFKNQFSSSVATLSNDLEKFITYHNNIFATIDEDDLVPFQDYNMLKSELLAFLEYFQINNTSSNYRFGILEYKLHLDDKDIANIERTSKNISEIITNIIFKK